jgi:hypothetical protein|eukprot:COSAG06_NODE_3727_length_4971_cov_2.507389_5_plen_37_part_00
MQMLKRSKTHRYITQQKLSFLAVLVTMLLKIAQRLL